MSDDAARWNAYIRPEGADSPRVGLGGYRSLEGLVSTIQVALLQDWRHREVGWQDCVIRIWRSGQSGGPRREV